MTKNDLDFEGLECYQKSLKLYSAAYRLASKLPNYERQNMADQLRRASLSVLLNIAEGYGRYHYLDKLRLFYYARGSLSETLSVFICAKEAGYIDEDQLQWARTTESEAGKSLNGYINFIKQRKQGSEEYGNKHISEQQSDYNFVEDIEEDRFSNLYPQSPVTNHQSPINKENDIYGI